MTRRLKSLSRGKVRLKQMDIGKILDSKISIHDTGKNYVEDWAHDFSLLFILSKAFLKLLQCAGVKRYHKSVLGGQKMAPTPKALLNEHNISDFQKALLEDYKALDNSAFNLSPCKAFRGPFSIWYSIFNNEIQKFIKELNGVMIRTLDENCKINEYTVGPL